MKKIEYSSLNNILYILRNTWKLDRSLVCFSFLQVFPVVIVPLLTSYLLKFVIELITVGTDVINYIIYIFIFSLILLVFNLSNNFLSTRIQWRSFGSRFSFLSMVARKSMETDYFNIENPDGQNKMQKAINSLYSNNSGTQQIFAQLANLCSNIIGVITYSILLFRFNPLIIAGLVFLSALSFCLQRLYNNWIHKNRDNWIPIDRKLNYISNKLGDYAAAKDIRLFHMSKWFDELFLYSFKFRNAWHKKTERRNFLLNFLISIINSVRDGGAYIILIYYAASKVISVGDFIFYFNLIASYSGWLFGIINSLSQINVTSLSLCDLRNFLDLPDQFNRNKGILVPQKSCEIEFDNVSFAYPGSDKLILDSISFTIKKGEKIALVGLNGAGKTTLIKLLCGLYLPSSGSIKINGKNIQLYNIYEYYSLFSVVFQDIYLLPVSIEKNIALTKDINVNKLNMSLRLSGLDSKIEALPKKEKTVLLKSIFDDAVDLSGGEIQKLALARAIYKNGIILLLDEPTAALDPIAESNIYKQYNNITKDKTSIFISHRLSSTVFCDRILFLEKGKIIEDGTHNELMNLKGMYYELYNTQSKYYKEEGEN